MVTFHPEESPDNSPIGSNTPINLRPDLSELGIEEIERGICADNFANRRIIRQAKMQYKQAYDIYGRLTGNLEVISIEMSVELAKFSLMAKQPLLKDPRNMNSDYLTGFDLYASGAEEYAPAWVLGAVGRFIKADNDGTYNPAKHYLPQRCIKIKHDGIRCMVWGSGDPTFKGFCRIHVAETGAVRETTKAARMRLAQAAPEAVDVLEDLMLTAQSEPVRLNAARDILDRAGIRGGVEIDLNADVVVRPASEVVMERLAALKPKATETDEELDIEDAVIVEPELPAIEAGGESDDTSGAS